MDPHQTDAGFFVLDAVVRRPAKAVHGEKKMKEEGQGGRSRANYQIRSDLNVEFGDHKIGQTCFMMTADDMKLWDDKRIIEAAAESAVELCVRTSVDAKLGIDKTMRIFEPLAKLLGWCLVHADEIKLARKEAK